MTRDPLCFYPRAWRDRYGDEMRALIDDDLDGRAPSRRYVARLAVAGILERARSSGYVGDSPPEARKLAGSFLVLYAWVAMVAAGGSFAKAAEHFRSALPPGARTAPSVAYDLVVAAAIGGGLLLGAAALVALPGFVAAVRARRVTGAGSRAVAAAVVTVIAAIGTIGIAHWAHGLTPAQRNGADGAYSAVVIVWALLGVSSLGLWARVATRAARVCLSARALRVEPRLTAGVALCATVVAAGSALWWSEMASRAPIFLTGSRGASVVTVRMVGTLGLMLVAVLVAAYGAGRSARARA